MGDEDGEVVIATVEWWAALSYLWNMWLCTCLVLRIDGGCWAMLGIRSSMYGL